LDLSLFVLASGSRGNALLIKTQNTRLMVDCGLGVRTLLPLMQSVGVHPKDLNTILITHEHTDHVRGIERFFSHTRAALYASEGTLDAIDRMIPARATVGVATADAFDIGGIAVQAIPVPHDAAEPLAYHITIGEHRLTVATDLGEVTRDVAKALKHSTIAVFESNHDEDMLQNGSYPEILKRRIRSSTGHLSNRQCSSALESCRETDLSTVILAHLSDENNEPEIARATTGAILDGTVCSLYVTRQGTTGPYLNFSNNLSTKGQPSCEPLHLFP
jgi:phosphoribosyl 1,2-cyclic phosphodiesterase